VFADGKRGDGIWMFSLDGAIEPVATEGAPASGALAALRAGAAAPAGPGDVANGERVYREACLPCHGASGEGGEGGGASLVAGVTREAALAVTANGRNNMPAFRDAYSAAELNDVATYVVETLAAKETPAPR
jgi:mono/diheme cytochrome c family protein